MATHQEFEERAAPFRREIFAHCYRMAGSLADAEDLVQETMLRAWRAFDSYDPSKASVRTWLYRIATNACLNALESAKRRELPSGLGRETTAPDAPFVRGEVPWVEPFPDAGIAAVDPLAALVARGTLRLALVAAMQHLPARQRAVLILRDVLEQSAADVAVALETTTTAVNSALDRARATLERAHISIEHVEDAGGARTTLDRYVAAFERADVEALRALLTADVVLEMPPMLNWMIGPGAYGAFMERVWKLRGREWKAVPLSASGQAAFAAYVRVADGTFVLHTLQVFEIGLGGIARNTTFQDPALFARFGLQPSL